MTVTVRIGQTTMQYATLDEAANVRDALIEKLQDIDVQLGTRRPAPGVRMAEEDFARYQDWKTKTLVARRHGLRHLREVKSFIRERNVSRSQNAARAAGFDPMDPESLIREAARVLHRIACETDIEDDEQVVIDALRDHCDRADQQAVTA